MVNKDDLIKEWDEMIKNPQNVGPQGGEEREALIKRIQDSDMSSEELKSLLVDIIKKCLQKRMELEVELSKLKASSQ